MPSSFTSVCYNGTMFIIVGGNAEIQTSSDGISWTQRGAIYFISESLNESKVKNLYICYNFAKDLQKWISEKEMVIDCEFSEALITIEFITGEDFVLREYCKNGNLSAEISYKNGSKYGFRRYDKNGIAQ